MKRVGMVFVIIITMLLVTAQGCERTTPGGGGGVFIGGKSGLTVEFVEDAPSISGNYQNMEFPIEVRLTNKGESDVASGAANIYLTGALYSLGSDVVDVSVKEASNEDVVMAVEEGTGGLIEDSVVVPMGKVNYKGEIFADSIPLDVNVAVCYPYETKVQVNDFCIPSTEKTVVGEEACSVDSSVNLIDEGDNSGATVHVTSLREDKGPGYVRVILDINNVGSGDVLTECAREVTKEKLDKVKVTMPQGFKCSNFDDSNTGEIELRSGHATLRCKKDVTNTGNAYKEPILITLGAYHYRQELSKTITVNKAE